MLTSALTFIFVSAGTFAVASIAADCFFAYRSHKRIRAQLRKLR